MGVDIAIFNTEEEYREAVGGELEGFDTPGNALPETKYRLIDPADPRTVT